MRHLWQKQLLDVEIHRLFILSNCFAKEVETYELYRRLLCRKMAE